MKLAPADRDGVTRGRKFDKVDASDAVMLGLFRKNARRALIATLYERVATASRQPDLYLQLGVPDNLEGRFEALCLHMVLALRGLRRLPAPADDVAKDLTDAFFARPRCVLSEMGVGDAAIPKRMKKLAEAFYGRAGAYDPRSRGRRRGGPRRSAAAQCRRSRGTVPRLARYALQPTATAVRPISRSS